MSDELPDYTEASTGPGQHVCRGNLVDTVIGDRQIVLVCYECRQYWHTGALENCHHPTFADLVQAAEHRYRQEAAA
jgi:hypothetical protein